MHWLFIGLILEYALMDWQRAIQVGLFMTNYPHLNNLFVFGGLVSLGLVTALVPFAGDLPNLFILLFFVGFLIAAVHTGGNVLCLDIWSGFDSGPHIHSIHFCYSFGAFFAPILASPFLSKRIQTDELPPSGHFDHLLRQFHPHLITTTEITKLYPIIGIGTFLVSFGFLHYGIEDLKRRKSVLKTATDLDSNSDEYEKPQEQKATPFLTQLLVALFSLFLFLYVGMEYCFGTYLTTFAYESRLNLTRIQGANLTAIFWGAFSFMRFLAIFAAFYISPLVVLAFSFVICFFGTFTLIFIAEQSYEALALGTGVLGFGMGTIFATGLSWLEKYININNGAGTILVVAGTLGPDMFPVLLGQFLEKSPMVLIYTQFGVIVACIILFIGSYCITKRLK
ncbi:sodium-dependent glucose transporter 1C-like isoform X2 [Tigriopus californicus]|uniref:sodium-dependent glucose transporter 1C-like isoform X2 n=1 Tax=Tigriopus californicus TaxID=6832 RepID=UPI0027D9F856|nr:sodium-dependent glucose transporter 1C-like isoform X2 [Tigriopus californicus]